MGKEDRWPASFNELDSELGDELDDELDGELDGELEDYVGDELNGCDEFEPRGSFAVLVGEGDPICENCVNWDGQYCNIAGQAGHGGRCDGR